MKSLVTTQVFVTTNVNSSRSEMKDKVKQFIPIAAFFIIFLVALFIFSKMGPIAEQHIKSETLKSVNFILFYAFLSMLAGLFAINPTKKRLNINYNYIPSVACFFIAAFGTAALHYLEPIITEHIKLKIFKSNYKVLSSFVPFTIGSYIVLVMNQKLNASTRSEKTIL